MSRGRSIPQLLFISLCLLIAGSGISFGQIEFTPLHFLREQEWKHRDQRGEVYLGKVMTLTYPDSSVEPDPGYHPLLLELTDVLKTPLRDNYRMVLRGESDLPLSRERAERLKESLVRDYYFEGRRITIETSSKPAAGNQNPALEIDVYGDVTEAVRYVDREEGK